MRPILDVLAAVGFLHDDRIPAIQRWFTNKTADLPTAMTTDLRLWFEVMRHGHTIPPRSKPRAPRTIQIRLRQALPALHAWAAAGHQHLRQITRDDVLAVLPGSSPSRHAVLSGLRSIFRLLKAHKRVFLSSTARIQTDQPARPIPLPTPIETIRDALRSDDPTRTAIASLVAFHALLPRQLRDLQLTDIRDRRLHHSDRSIPLAQPVQQRLNAYLNYRATRWPATANPHLFIHYHSANHLGRVTTEWLAHRLGLSTQALRQDRILHEVHATRGDIRRLCDLFGLSVSGAERYTAVLDHPDLAVPGSDEK